MQKARNVGTAVSSTSYECTIAVECSVFGFQGNQLKILLVKRSIKPFEGSWVLPGGVMSENETLSESVDNVLVALTGIREIHHQQVRCYSKVDRHPIKRVVSVLFYALVKPENHPVLAKNYISDVKWFSISELPELGFDHQQLFQDALHVLKENLKQNLVFGELLPDRFTLKELQDLYENILEIRLDRRNFRKKMLQLGVLKSTNEKKPGARGGPELYSLS
ncbi:MAG: NUDIX domain-containing protein [Bacteroidota bacterium]